MKPTLLYFDSYYTLSNSLYIFVTYYMNALYPLGAISVKAIFLIAKIPSNLTVIPPHS
jgi:hypothetical protein